MHQRLVEAEDGVAAVVVGVVEEAVVDVLLATRFGHVSTPYDRIMS